jgi:4-hydroxybenzoate polyprenyltransferase
VRVQKFLCGLLGLAVLLAASIVCFTTTQRMVALPHIHLAPGYALILPGASHSTGRPDAAWSPCTLGIF